MRGVEVLLEWDEDVHCADCSVLLFVVAFEKGIVSLVSPDSEVYDILFAYLALAYRRISLTAIGGILPLR